MGVPVPEMNPDMSSVDQAWAETFLSSLRTISAPERRKHASVYNYRLSIRAGREFPPIRDLDPLEISDAGPFSVLLEMIGGGEDAEIRHVGHAIKGGIQAEKVSEAPHGSLLSCIATRLPVVAGCRDAFAFEDEIETSEGKKRCWITLLPFSATGTWIDYVYGFVTLDGATAEGSSESEAEVAEDLAPTIEEAAGAERAEELAVSDAFQEEPADELTEEAVPEALELEETYEPESPPPPVEPTPPARPGFSAKFFEGLSKVGSFYGTPVESGADAFAGITQEQADEPAEFDEPVEEEVPAVEPEALEDAAETRAERQKTVKPFQALQADDQWRVQYRQPRPFGVQFSREWMSWPNV